jgi:hypothetical protein
MRTSEPPKVGDVIEQHCAGVTHRYTAIAVNPSGRSWRVKWQGKCCVCGAPFEQDTGATIPVSMNRNCFEHYWITGQPDSVPNELEAVKRELAEMRRAFEALHRDRTRPF